MLSTPSTPSFIFRYKLAEMIVIIIGSL
jgi:hypothetical protein